MLINRIEETKSLHNFFYWNIPFNNEENVLKIGWLVFEVHSKGTVNLYLDPRFNFNEI